jgi:hypothetical protein
MIPAFGASSQTKKRGPASLIEVPFRARLPAILARRGREASPAANFGAKRMPEGASDTRGIHWTNVITVLSAAILIGAEFVVASLALGWAIADRTGLGDIFAYVLQAIFLAAACVIIFNFVRRAAKIEPFVGR